MVQKYYGHSILYISTTILKEILLKLGCLLGVAFYVQQVCFDHIVSVKCDTCLKFSNNVFALGAFLLYR
jgi:hypothetical protein